MQEIRIQWRNGTSSCFTISNRKVLPSTSLQSRGILSPVLFVIYMDDRSVLLARSIVRCHIDDLCTHHVFYADELCLMTPYAIALQKLRQALLYLYINDQLVLNYNDSRKPCLMLVVLSPQYDTFGIIF